MFFPLRHHSFEWYLYHYGNKSHSFQIEFFLPAIELLSFKNRTLNWKLHNLFQIAETSNDCFIIAYVLRNIIFGNKSLQTWKYIFSTQLFAHFRCKNVKTTFSVRFRFPSSRHFVIVTWLLPEAPPRRLAGIWSDETRWNQPLTSL